MATDQEVKNEAILIAVLVPVVYLIGRKVGKFTTKRQLKALNK